MKKLCRRTRYYALVLASGSLFFLGSCGLSDQQLAQIWESVISAGLGTIVSNAIRIAGGQTATTA
jgi:hypothetical protein